MTALVHQQMPRWFKPTHQLKLHFMLLFPWFIPLISYLLLGRIYLQDIPTFLSVSAINLTIALTCLLTIDWLTKLIIGWLPDLSQALTRVTLLFLMFSTVTPAFILGSIWTYDHFHWFGYSFDWTVVKYILIFNVLANVVSVAVSESMHSLAKWRETMLEKEQLRKATLQGQVESLKNQVNPHFLFNTLNSLSSLINDEPERAELFVDEMANVYRYLLQTNDRELTLLSTEINFITSYFHLLKTRYGQGIELEVTIADAFMEERLPPLTLQMLVENAVKHNVIMANKPLHISIRTTPDRRLIVQNTLQRKASRTASNKVGLANISAKYRLLAQAEVVVQETDDQFTVILPLIEKGAGQLTKF